MQILSGEKNPRIMMMAIMTDYDGDHDNGKKLCTCLQNESISSRRRLCIKEIEVFHEGQLCNSGGCRGIATSGCVMIFSSNKCIAKHQRNFRTI